MQSMLGGLAKPRAVQSTGFWLCKILQNLPSSRPLETTRTCLVPLRQFFFTLISRLFPWKTGKHPSDSKFLSGSVHDVYSNEVIILHHCTEDGFESIYTLPELL